MLSLKRIIEKGKKFSFYRPFNLRKFSQIVEPPQVEQMPITPVQEIPTIEPPVAYEEEVALSPEITNVIDEYININANEIMAFKGGNYQAELGVLDIWNEVKNNEMANSYLINSLMEKGNFSQAMAQALTTVVLAKSENVMQGLQEQGYQEYVHQEEEETGVVNVDLANKYLEEIYNAGKIDGLKYYVLSKVGGNEEAADNIIVESINYALGDTGKSVDQRLNFFIKNQNKIPEKIKVRIGEIGKPSYGSKEHINVINRLKEDENIGRELLWELERLIGVEDDTVNKWVGSAIKTYGLKTVLNEMRGGATSLDRPIGEEGQSVGGLVGGERKGELSRFKEEDPVIKKKEEIIYKNMITIFARDYCNRLFNSTNELRENVIQNMMKVGGKTQFRAERVNIYMSIALQQLNNLFSIPPDEIKSTDENVTYSNQGGSLTVPKEILKNLLNKQRDEVIDEVDQDEADQYGADQYGARSAESVMDLTEERLLEYVKNYGLGEWQPNWNRLLKPGPIEDAFKKVGELKNKIKDMQKQNPSDSSQVIAIKLGNVENSNFLMSLFGEDLSQFVERTMQQDEKYVNMYLGAGEGKRKDTRPGSGLKHVKEQLAIDINEINGYIYDMYKDEIDKEGFNFPQIRTFTDLFNPHSEIRSGGEMGRPRNPVAKNMSNTELYYKLRGENIPDGIERRMNLNKKRFEYKKDKEDLASKEEKLKEMKKDIKKNIKEPLEQEERLEKIDRELGIINNEYKNIASEMKSFSEYFKYEKDYILTKNKADYLNKQIKLIDDKINAKYDKVRRRGGTDFTEKEEEIISRLRENKKELEDKRDMTKIELEGKSKILEELENKHFASEIAFKIAYAQFINTKKDIFRLADMKQKYKNLKFSSTSLHGIDDLAYKRFNQFKVLFYKLLQ